MRICGDDVPSIMLIPSPQAKRGKNGRFRVLLLRIHPCPSVFWCFRPKKNKPPL